MSSVLSVVECSNQRGGRMLSVIDLVRARTLTPEQAAWLLDRIVRGASWLVGARPGGAGKTTVMSALLAMLPAETEIRLASGNGWKQSAPGDCVVAYEIGAGFYEAYVWARELHHFCKLGAAGCRIVSNLHADTLEQAHTQIVKENGVPEAWFNQFDIFIPIIVSGSWADTRRSVETIQYCSDGVWAALDAGRALSERAKRIADFLTACERRQLVQIEEVRAAWLSWLEENA